MGFKKGHKINLGNKWNKGRILTSEHRLKISKSLKGRKDIIEKCKLAAKVRWNNHIKKYIKVKNKLILKKRKYQTYKEKYPNGTTEKKRFSNMRYKVRKINAVGSHTFKEWLLLKMKYKNMCLCCKRFEPEIKLTEDHIVPLSMGGTDNIENIQPLCVNCNSRKSIKKIDFRENYEVKGGEIVFIN